MSVGGYHASDNAKMFIISKPKDASGKKNFS